MKKTSETTIPSGDKTRLIFFGNERLATGVSTTVPVLRALIAAGYDVVAVISNYERGSSRSNTTLEIESVARDNNIPFLSPSRLTDIAADIKSMQPTAGILVAYGKKVPESIIQIFPKGIINLHPSDLPLHRGPTPIESIILDGSTETAISIMQLTAPLDAGPIYAKRLLKISGHETKQVLADMLMTNGCELLIQALPAILSGQIVPTPQDDTSASYDQLIKKDDGKINWGKPASRIEREIRAYANWPKSYTKLADKDVIITSASIFDLSGSPGSVHIIDKQIIVCCGQGSLNIQKLKPAGKKEMVAGEFLAGHREKLTPIA